MLEYPLERFLYRVSIHPLGQQHLVRVRRLARPGWSAAVESTGARGGRFPQIPVLCSSLGTRRDDVQWHWQTPIRRRARVRARPARHGWPRPRRCGDYGDMTPSADWQNFAVMTGGASGALTGLLFVSVSLNASRIAGHQGLRASTAQTLVLFLAPLVMAMILLVPGQGDGVLGAELVA
jgi:hypothetical protein